MRIIKFLSVLVGGIRVVFFFFWWKYLSIIIGQDVVICVSQKDFIRVARLFLKGS